MMSREMSGWMSVSDESGSCLVLFHKTFRVYRVNWLRAKARVDRWQEEDWSRMKNGGCTCGWNTMGKSGKEGQKRGFERTCLLCLEAGVDVGKNGKRGYGCL